MVTVNEYLDLIIPQYKTSEKFMRWNRVLFQPFVNTQNLLNSLDEYFDINTAVGKQLDILGDKVGAKRLLPFQPENGLDPLLKDEDYRFLIKATVLKNIWHGSNEGIYEIWSNLFNNIWLSLSDNQDMTITVLIIGNISELQKQMVKNGLIVPKAQGVKMYYAFSIPPIYSYDQNEDYFKGHDEGNWLEFK